MRTMSLSGRGGARPSGFTLIEILIVVAIIAVIGGIVANRIFGGADKAKWRLAQAQIQTLAGKIEGYELDNGNPPEQLQDLVREPGNAAGWLGPYAKEAELKDPWNRPFEYRIPGESGKYDLISYGADGKPGGDSWNKDIRND
ncbi:MAG TPA: type II secretion system major pseudopilin GspG [Xanthomonadaceae bacterium]|nr:type II secretion system major pseudopilin GspG [Xanthomonadaceae bacterium]